MAYDHWYETLEWTSNQTKDWKTEVPTSYVDYTTKEYIIPWSKPAYYEGGNPVYARARSLQFEDVVGMYANRTTTYGIWNNIYEILHNTGSTSIMYYTETINGSGIGYPVKPYITNSWSGHGEKNPETNMYEYVYYHPAFISYFVVEVSKSKISAYWDMENDTSSDSYTIRSTEDYLQFGGSSYFMVQSQTSSDGGQLDVRDVYECTTYSSGYSYCNTYLRVYGLESGHVHLIVGRKDSSTTYEYDVTVDIQYSCGQVDMCGRTTASCDISEGGPINTDPTDPGTITSSTSTSEVDTTPPVCVLESVTQLTNGIQPRLTCTDDQSVPTIRSQWNVRPVLATGFDSSIGIVKNGTSTTLPNGAGYSKTVTPSWTTNDPISQPHPRDCYYFRYGAQDAAGNWSFYISDRCYYGFSNTNAGKNN